MKYTVADLLIEIDGSKLAEDWLSLVWDITVHLPEKGVSTMHITFADPARDWDKVTKFGGGAKVVATLGIDEKESDVFRGELTTVRSRVRVQGGLVLTLVGSDKLHRLKRNCRQRVLKDMTDGDLVKKLAGDNGMTADAQDPGAQYTSICQFGVTDYDLLAERAARIGYVYWADGDKLCFKSQRPSGGKLELKWGVDLLDLRVIRTAGRVFPEVQVHSWDVKAKKEQLGKAASGKEKQVGSGKAGLKAVQAGFSDPPVHLGIFPAASIKEAEAIALGRLQRSSQGFMVAKGRCRGQPAMKPGSMVTIKDVPKEFLGDYMVANVTHSFGQSGLLSEFELVRNVQGS